VGPRRIVCLTEETTELLYLLGEQDRIVGISAYTVRPPEAKTKPVVSAFINGSVPKIKALRPDLIVGFSDIQANLARDLIAEGLNVLVLNQRSISEILSAIELIGSMIGRSSDTARLVDDFKRRVDAAQSKRRESRPRVFFQEWDDPLISGIRWVSELIEIAGGQDIFAELREGSMARERIVSPDEVAMRMPDTIIASWCGKPVDFHWIKNKPEWLQIPAIVNDRIVEIDSSVILQPGPALFLEGLAALESAIHNRKE